FKTSALKKPDPPPTDAKQTRRKFKTSVLTKKGPIRLLLLTFCKRPIRLRPTLSNPDGDSRQVF
ncbi:MAG: hypothetical protein ACKPKO_56380, partial [Candidatus Fonsibacter sp.]